MKPWLKSLLFAAMLFGMVRIVVALPKYTKEEGKGCAYCHVEPEGGGTLNLHGTTYLKQGHTFETEEETEVKEEPSDAEEDESVKSTVETTPPPPDTPAEKAQRARVWKKTLAQIKKNRALTRREVYEKYLKSGKALFQQLQPSLTTTGKTCMDCHKANELAVVIKEYPRFRDELETVVSMDRMIRYCIFQRMKGKALPPDSSLSTSLAVYLKEVGAGHSP